MATHVGDLVVQHRARFSEDHRRFIDECRSAAGKSALQLAEAVENLAELAAWSTSGPVTAQPSGAYSALATAWGRTASIQEFGAKPHRITSGDGGPLANKEEGFFAKSGKVNHPGVKARHFLSQAARAAAHLGPTIISRNFPG